MSLLAPWLLLGGLLSGVPLLLHMLNKSKFKVEPWGAMMFLQSAVRAKAQRIKVQQWLLLLLRVLFFVFLSIALSRPIIQKSEVGSSDQPISHVVILDGSYSMQRNGENGMLFEKARQRCLEVVDHMKRGDNMSLIWAGEKPREIFGELTYDRDLLRSKIEQLQPGEEQADLPRALEKAMFSLEKSTLPVHRVYVISDEQESNWNIQKSQYWTHLKDHLKLKKVKPGFAYLDVYEDESRENARIVNVSSASPVIDPYRQTRFWIDIDYHGGEKSQTHIKFYVDGELKGQRDLILNQGSQRIDFEHRFTTSGYHVIEAKLGQDNLSIDNQYSRALLVRERLPVLMIDAYGPNSNMSQGGHILKMALQSAVDLGEPSLIDVTHTAYIDLDNMNLEQLKHYRSIILVDVPSLSQYAKFMLEQYLAEGGGLMVTMGPEARIEDYNKLYRGEKGLLPAKMLSKSNLGLDRSEPMVLPSNHHPVLELFSNEQGRVLNGVKVNRHVELELAKAAVPLIKMDNAPLVVYQTFKKGRVLLWGTDVTGQWSNIPFTRHFLPLVQNLVLYLSATVEPPIHLSQGEPLISSWVGVSEKKPKDVKMTKPDGMTEFLKLNYERGQWVVRYDQMHKAGIYKIEGPGAVRYVSVHLPIQEGVLEELGADTQKKIDAFVSMEKLQVGEDFIRHLVAGMENFELWKWVLLFSILILSLEGYLSWRFSR